MKIGFVHDEFSSKAAAVLLLPLFLCFPAVRAMPQQNKTINWTMSLQNVKSGDSIPFSAAVKSRTGEQFRILIQPETGCFCYMIAESPGGEDVAVLLAGPLKGGEIWYSPILELSAPSGTESFFIITSREEQKALVQRIAAFKDNSGSAQKRALMNEIFRVRSETSKFKEAPEKPVLMGGAARGTPEKNQGVEFSGLETYVKTISIEH